MRCRMRERFLFPICSLLAAVTATATVQHAGDFDFNDLVGFESSLNQAVSSGNYDAALVVAQIRSPNFMLTVNWGPELSPRSQNFNAQSGQIFLNSDDPMYLSPPMREAYDDGAIPADELE